MLPSLNLPGPSGAVAVSCTLPSAHRTSSAIVADASPLLRRALADILRQDLGITEVHEADSLATAQSLACGLEQPLVILDRGFVATRTKAALARFARKALGCKLVLFGVGPETGSAAGILASGACAVLDKRLDEAAFRLAVQAVLRGEHIIRLADRASANNGIDLEHAELWSLKLRPRHKEVLRLIGLGMKNRDIAEALGLCEPTVKHHARTVMSMLQLTNRTKAAVCANWLCARGLL